MLPLFALLVAQAAPNTNFRSVSFDGLLGPKSLMVRTPTERLSTPKLSPKQGWEFDWTSSGYVGDENRKELRFDLYSQESTAGSSRPEGVIRLLLRLYSFNIAKLRLDHASEFGHVVHVYLCYGGDAGGEQLFDVDHQLQDSKVDTIYFYDLRSFTDPVEIVREIAHEYGHATIPPVGGYTAPEYWANGYLGEKLYLKYLAQASAQGQVPVSETFGATPELLQAWVHLNVDPLVDQALKNGPKANLLAAKDKAGMDAFFGLALATAQLYSPERLIRALVVNGNDPKTFPTSAATAAEEPEFTTLNIPASLKGAPIWIPLGEGKVIGAEITEKRDGWAHIKPRPGGKPVVVTGIKRT